MAQKPPLALPLAPLRLHPSRSTAVWAVGRFLFAYDWQRSGWETRRRALHGEAIRALDALPGAQGKTTWLSAGDDKVVMTWSEAGGDWEHQHSYSNQKKITAAIFDKDGCVVFGDRFGDVLRWVPGEDDAKLLSSHFAIVTTIALTPSGKYLVVGDNHEKVRISCYPETAEIRSFCFGHASQITAVVGTALDDAERVLSASADGTLRLWSLDGQECKCWKLAAPCSSASLAAGTVALGTEVPAAGLARLALDGKQDEVSVLLPEAPQAVCVRESDGGILWVDRRGHLRIPAPNGGWEDVFDGDDLPPSLVVLSQNAGDGEVDNDEAKEEEGEVPTKSAKKKRRE